MCEIAEWLKKPDYSIGVQLYEKHGTNGFLKKKFASAYNDYNRDKLSEELKKLVNEQVFIKPNSPEKQGIKNTENLPAKNKVQADHARKYIDLVRKKEYLYRELNELMATKHHLPEGEDLRICAAGILKKHRQISEIWVLEDHYQQHRSFPENKTKPSRPIDQEIQYLRVSISKAEVRLASVKCRDKRKTETLLNNKRSHLDQLLAKQKADE